MDTSDWISLTALFVSVVSVLFARFAASQAGRANDIALHSEKLKIFKGFLEFRREIAGMGSSFDESTLCRLYEHIQLSEFYFGQKFYDQLKQLWDCAYNVVGERQQVEYKAYESEEERKQLMIKVGDLFRQCKEKAAEVEEEFKKRLRLEVTL